MAMRSLTMSDRTESTYLGDGLYVKISGDMVVLFATNGMIVHDEVCLEPEVLSNFMEYLTELANSNAGDDDDKSS